MNSYTIQQLERGEGLLSGRRTAIYQQGERNSFVTCEVNETSTGQLVGIADDDGNIEWL